MGYFVITREQVIAARKPTGLSQKQAGAVVHSTGSAWQKWELGERNMPRAKYELFLEKTKKEKKMTQQVINATGEKLIAEWLESVAKNPQDQNLDAWYTKAENAAENAAPGESIIIELEAYKTVSRCPETLRLSTEHFD